MYKDNNNAKGLTVPCTVTKLKCLHIYVKYIIDVCAFKNSLLVYKCKF